MPGWLGVTLMVAFGLVASYRAGRRDAPGTLMALGMAVMAIAMAHLREYGDSTAFGFLHPTGPWWAAGFAVIALWPLVSRQAGQVCGGPAVHLVGGLAMIYMCLRVDPPGTTAPTSWDTVPAASANPLSGVGHAGHGGPPLTASIVANPVTAVTPVDAAFALAGWALACYFLLATVTALTRRNRDGTLALPRRAAIGEAVMGFGTVIMLAAMT